MRFTTSSLFALVIVASSAGAAWSEPTYRATVELADTDGSIHAIVTAKLVCDTPAKCPAWTLDLGPAEEAGLVAVVDLLGEPSHLGNTSALAEHTASLPGSTKLPAAVVRTKSTDAAHTHWERWTIVSLVDGRAKQLWRGEMAMVAEKGGGFATKDGIDLVTTEAGKPLALALVQTTIPKPGEKAHAPAKPVSRRFVLANGTYQRQ